MITVNDHIALAESEVSYQSTPPPVRAGRT